VCAVHRKQPRVRDLLARRSAVDLEHGAGQLAADRRPRLREQPGDPVHHLVDAGSRDRGAEEHRMDHGAAGLRLQLALESVLRQGKTVEVDREDLLVVLGQPVGEPRSEPDVRRIEGRETSRDACRSHASCPSRRSTV
jgi:hypothetical protein